MADDFDAAGISWWSSSRTTTSSSTSNFDSTSAITTASEPSISAPLIDSSLQISGYGMDWNHQSLLRSSSNNTSTNTPRAEASFHSMLQESLNYPPLDPHHQQFLIDNQQHQQGLPMMLQGLFESEAKPQQPMFDQLALNNYQQSQASHQFLASQSLKQQNSASNLQFSNNTPFWNASSTDVSEGRSAFYPPMPVQFSTSASAQRYDHKPSSSSNLTTKSNSDTVAQKKSEPALKKPRVETPSPLPTFKVRKEKLGDRITALQQLVSPFGKTDTASVLHEAIEYIKFLHDQVNVLTTPYLKNGHPMQHQQQSSSDKSRDGEGPKQDLRSRGLCLVPIESTYPVASETTADFWTPTFGGSYR